MSEPDSRVPSSPAADSTRQDPTSGPPPGSVDTSRKSGARAGNFVMGTITSAIELVKSPVTYVTAHKDDPATVRDIMVNWVVVLALIPFVATLIGDLWYYSLLARFTFAGSYATYAFVQAILFFILDIIGVYIVAIVIRVLAPTFNSKVDQIMSLKLAAYIFTPGFLIGALDIIPPLAVLGILGTLYGLYILYLALPIMLGTPKDKVITYVIGVVVATLIIYVIIGVIIGLVTAAIFLASFGFFF